MKKIYEPGNKIVFKLLGNTHRNSIFAKNKVKCMNKNQLEKIKKVVQKWVHNKEFSFQERKVEPIIGNLALNGEIILVFHSFTKSFFYNKEATEIVPLDFSSKPFITTTLSDTALIENPEQDVNRLISFLNNFDREIETKREEILSQYDGEIYTSNPELWDL